jgi:LPS-assembly protein
MCFNNPISLIVSAFPWFALVSQLFLVVPTLKAAIADEWLPLGRCQPTASNTLCQGCYDPVKCQQQHFLLTGQQAFFQRETAQIDNAQFIIYDRHAHGSASRLQTGDKDSLALTTFSYTTCSPRQPTWWLRAKRAKLQRSRGRGQAWHARLYWHNVPIFYWPYVDFPLDKRRQSGFLYPSYRYSSRDGSSYVFPYYINLAPNYDATITPIYMQKRGLKFDNEWRSLTRQQQGIFQYNLLPRDAQYQREIRQYLSNPGSIRRDDARYQGLQQLGYRYALGLQHSWWIQPSIYAEAQYFRVSDQQYLYDFPEDLSASGSRSSLPQRLQVHWYQPSGYTYARVSNYQVLHPFQGQLANQEWQQLPQLGFVSYPWYFTRNWSSKLELQYTNFRQQQALGSKRYYAKPSLQYEHDVTAYYIRPQVAYHLVNHNARVPIYAVDSGIRLERHTSWRQDSYTHVLEPRLMYLQVPSKPRQQERSVAKPKPRLFDTSLYTFDYYQLFRDNRYSGYDLVGDTEQVAAGLENRWVDPQGAVMAQLGVGRLRYLRTRQLLIPGELDERQARHSPWAVTGHCMIAARWRVYVNLLQNRLFKERRSSYTLQYRYTPQQVANLGYTYERQVLHTWHVSSAWAVTHAWRLFAKVDYDQLRRRLQSGLLGVERHTCCMVWRCSAGQQRPYTANLNNRKSQKVVMLQVVFKGLAGINDGDSVRLEQLIPGYKVEEHRF